ncbi:MAG: flagellar type III secretion system pore protein FliP [Thermoguttaceae bacterium]|jgi:flagellar biosynthetic protein FliP
MTGRTFWRCALFSGTLLGLFCLVPSLPAADSVPFQETSELSKLAESATQNVESLLPTVKELTSGGNLPLLFALLAIVPALLITTTCYVRVITVLSLLRQAIGLVQIPSAQILAVVAFFLTILMMSPTWTRVYREAWVPYAHQEIAAEEAFHRAEVPIRTFLWKQIERTRNTEMIGVFLRYVSDAKQPEYYEDIPWRVLVPAFMLSELKTAFLIGFQLFLPFVIIDLVVSGVMVSMGIMMLPPTAVSLPFKLMLFVLLDAWDPVVQMLFDGFALM